VGKPNLGSCLCILIMSIILIPILIFIAIECSKAIYSGICTWGCAWWEVVLGIPCLSCEYTVYIFVKYVVPIMCGLFILFLILGIILCFVRSGKEEEEEEEPTIIIEGSGPLLLYRETPTSGSPVLSLNGVGEPSGGTYKWTILSGAEKIDVISDMNNSIIRIKPVQQSDPPGGDVKLLVTYTTSDGSATSQTDLTVHTPKSAVKISQFITTFNGPNEYGYDFTVRYRILDQLGNRFPEGHLFLDEDLIVLSNPYNTQFEEREYMSDDNAEYNDNYTLIYYNQPIPNDFLARVRQIVRAQGIEILNHILVWKSTGVEFE